MDLDDGTDAEAYGDEVHECNALIDDAKKRLTHAEQAAKVLKSGNNNDIEAAKMRS